MEFLLWGLIIALFFIGSKKSSPKATHFIGIVVVSGLWLFFASREGDAVRRARGEASHMFDPGVFAGNLAIISCFPIAVYFIGCAVGRWRRRHSGRTAEPSEDR
jgi:hypothetical protein